MQKEDAYDWIIPADEKLLNVLNDRIHNEEIFYRILPFTKIENRDILASKAGLSRICDKHGIASPKYIVHDHKTTFNTAAFNLRYPVLLKQDLSWGGGGILFCDDEKSFKDNLEKTNKEYATIIQEYITGKDIGVEAMYRDGELVEYNAGEVTTYFDSKFTFTTKRNYFNSKRLEYELREIGKNVGIHGFASIQFNYQTQEDIYYLLEVDIRPNFWLASGRFTGHDFSKAVAGSFRVAQFRKMQFIQMNPK
jgi:predicted ATP-grasp superfamily ATP-dependent carboligase